MKSYVCDICNYIYNPETGDEDTSVAPGTAFADLPQGWLCPLCSAEVDQFSPVE